MARKIKMKGRTSQTDKARPNKMKLASRTATPAKIITDLTANPTNRIKKFTTKAEKKAEISRVPGYSSDIRRHGTNKFNVKCLSEK